MPVTGAEMTACARGWLGTRFQHQGRLKRTAAHPGGVDCLGLLVGVAEELQLQDRRGRPLAQADMRDYAHLPDTAQLRRRLAAALQEAAPDAPREGDVLLLAIDGRAQHLGLVSRYGSGAGLIHAYAPARGVVEHALDAWWRERVRAVFRPAVTDDF